MDARRKRDFGSILLLFLALLLLSMMTVVNEQKAAPSSEAHSGGATLQFSEYLISNDYTYGYGIAAADLDGDGDLDLTSSDCTTMGSRKHNDIYWFENDGKGNFTRHYLAKDDWYGRYERQQLADVNGDGRPDLVSVDNFFGSLIWFENSGQAKDGQLWKRHSITEGGLLGAYDVDVADLDADGDLDIATSSWRLGNQFSWYKNPGKARSRDWEAHIIDDNQAETRTVCVADFNRDGRPDVLGTVNAAGIVLWYENSGQPTGRTWKRHVIDLAGQPMHGHPVDLDGDGDLDVVMVFYSDQVVWYENLGKPGNGVKWDKHTIVREFAHGFEVVAADLDADGDLDVVATAAEKEGQIAWFENTGDPRSSWVRHSLKTPWGNAFQVITADLDGDGNLDIAAVSNLELRWWRNEGRQKK
jgi:hypothetical protein